MNCQEWNFHLGLHYPENHKGAGEHTECAVSSPGQLNGMARRPPAATPAAGARRAQEPAFAELDLAMAQDVVGGGAVKIEIRQRVVGAFTRP